MNDAFGIGFLIGFFVACMLIMIVGRLLRSTDSTPAGEQLEWQQLTSAQDLPLQPSDMALRQANHDAASLAGALESGLRSGWHFNYLMTRALTEHYARVGRRQVERSPRLN